MRGTVTLIFAPNIRIYIKYDDCLGRAEAPDEFGEARFGFCRFG